MRFSLLSALLGLTSAAQLEEVNADVDCSKQSITPVSSVYTSDLYQSKSYKYLIEGNLHFREDLLYSQLFNTPADYISCQPY